MVDRYTKVILTVIAGALLVIAVRGFTPTATAQFSSCTREEPCAVVNVLRDPGGFVPCYESGLACFTIRQQ